MAAVNLRRVGGRLRPAIVVLLLDWAALSIAIAVTPGLSASTGWDVLLAAVLLAIAAAVLRPVFAVFAARLGWTGVVAGWLLTQSLLVYLAQILAPHITVDGFWPAFWATTRRCSRICCGPRRRPAAKRSPPRSPAC
jgi:uncharacterized membrane protein YvlD (DUF360 family)